MKANLKKSKPDVKKSKAYKSLSTDAKLLYDYCLHQGAGNKNFEFEYDDFMKWVKTRYRQFATR